MSENGNSTAGNQQGSYQTGGYEVILPAGGKIVLKTPDEVEMVKQLADRYKKDFQLTKLNDLMHLNVILQHSITMYRAQTVLNGMEAEKDEDGRPTGRYVEVELSSTEQKQAQERLVKASEQISKIEQQLGIDKKTRESAKGQGGLNDYVSELKLAGHEYGVHIVKRIKMMEGLVNELSWRIRILRNGDAEDRAHHGITPDTIIELAEKGIAKIQEQDREYANEVGKLYLGKL